MDELPLGRKIYVLREDRSLSQTKLEVEAGLSFGTLSRIENGNINPTKETIIKIAQVLDLHDDEFNYLISLQKSSPDVDEIERVVGLVSEEIKNERIPAYLIDTKLRVWDWNKMILKLIGADDNSAEKYRGYTCMRLLFFSEFNIRNKIPKEKLGKIIKQQVDTYKYVSNKYRNETFTNSEIRELLKDVSFKHAWKTESELKYFPIKNEFHLKYGNNILNIDILLNRFSSDNRFIIVKYYPKDSRTLKVFESIRDSIYYSENKGRPKEKVDP